MFIKAWTQISAISIHQPGGNVISHFADISGFMLFVPLRWFFAGHAYIQALKDSVILGIGSAEFCIFGKHAF